MRVLQFNIEDPFGFFADRIDSNTLISLAEKVRANVLIVFARDGWGRVFYNGSRLYPRHHNSKLDVSKLVEEARSKGIRVVVMAAHTANRYLYRLHPKWAQRNIKGEVIVLEHYPRTARIVDPHWPLICLNSPALDRYFIPEVEEAVRLTNADGLLLDSFRYIPDPERACYCDYCKTKFREEYGEELPTKIDPEDEASRNAWEWRYKVTVRAIERMRDAVKRANPEALFMYNSHPAGWAGRGNIVVSKARHVLDGVFAEASEVDVRGPGMLTLITKLTRALLGEDKPVFVSRNLFYDLRPVHSPPKPVIRLGIYEIVASGGYPQATMFSSQFFTDTRAIEALEEVYSELEEMEEFLVNREPIRYAAILFDPDTHDKYYWSKPEYYIGEVEGTSLILMHNHLPWTIVSTQDVYKYADKEIFPIIIAPGTSIVSDEVEDHLEDYVSSGGLLVATHEFGYMRPDYTYREALALQHVLGIRYEGTLRFGFGYIHLATKHYNEYWKGMPEAIPLGDHSAAFVRERVEPRLGEITRAQPLAATPLALARLGRSAYGYEYTLGRSTPPPDSILHLAGISLNHYGSGTALYYSFRIGAHYSRLGLPDYSELLLRPLLRHAPKPPVILEAPDTVQMEPYVKKDGTIIVHLVNHTYNQRILSAPTGPSKQSPPGFDPAYRVHPIRSVIPVRNLTLRIRKDLVGNRVKATAFPKGASLKIEDDEEYYKVKIEKVHEHLLVVVTSTS